MAVGGVGPLVGKRLQLPGDQCAVGPDIGNNVGADGVADPVGDKGLLPAALQLHQASSAAQAVRALKVEYEELPFVLDVQEAMKDGAPQIQELRTLPQGRPRAWPTTRRTMWGIWVELTTTTRPASS